MTKQELLDAIRAATGPSRELDAEIARAFGWTFHNAFACWIPPDGWKAVGPLEGLPFFSSSLDAANAFREWVLPGWHHVSGYITGGCLAWVANGNGSGPRYTERCTTEPLSRVAAVITALIAQETNRDQ